MSRQRLEDATLIPVAQEEEEIRLDGAYDQAEERKDEISLRLDNVLVKMDAQNADATVAKLTEIAIGLSALAGSTHQTSSSTQIAATAIPITSAYAALSGGEIAASEETKPVRPFIQAALAALERGALIPIALYWELSRNDQDQQYPGFEAILFSLIIASNIKCLMDIYTAAQHNKKEQTQIKAAQQAYLDTHFKADDSAERTSSDSAALKHRGANSASPRDESKGVDTQRALARAHARTDKTLDHLLRQTAAEDALVSTVNTLFISISGLLVVSQNDLSYCPIGLASFGATHLFRARRSWTIKDNIGKFSLEADRVEEKVTASHNSDTLLGPTLKMRALKTKLKDAEEHGRAPNNTSNPCWIALIIAAAALITTLAKVTSTDGEDTGFHLSLPESTAALGCFMYTMAFMKNNSRSLGLTDQQRYNMQNTVIQTLCNPRRIAGLDDWLVHFPQLTGTSSSRSQWLSHNNAEALKEIFTIGTVMGMALSEHAFTPLQVALVTMLLIRFNAEMSKLTLTRPTAKEARHDVPSRLTALNTGTTDRSCCGFFASNDDEGRDSLDFSTSLMEDGSGL